MHATLMGKSLLGPSLGFAELPDFISERPLDRIHFRSFWRVCMQVLPQLFDVYMRSYYKRFFPASTCDTKSRLEPRMEFAKNMVCKMGMNNHRETSRTAEARRRSAAKLQPQKTQRPQRRMGFYQSRICKKKHDLKAPCSTEAPRKPGAWQRQRPTREN